VKEMKAGHRPHLVTALVLAQADQTRLETFILFGKIIGNFMVA
jgi:hypothetical protein